MAVTPEQKRKRDTEAKRRYRARAKAALAAQPPAPPALPVVEGKAKNKRKRARVMPAANPHTFVGRIDLMLERMGQKRRDLNAALGINTGLLAQHAREGSTLKGKNLAAAARYLGVREEWLLRGDALQVVPVNGSGNGNGSALAAAAKNSTRAAASMNDSLETTMRSLWGLLPPDVQAFVIARMAELLAQRARG